MQPELKGNQHVRFLRTHVKENGKKFFMGQVCRRSRNEAKQLIENKIAEVYNGPFPPKKMKTNFFKPKE